MPEEYASVESDGFVVSSNSESQEEMQEILGVKPDEKAKSASVDESEVPAARSSEPDKPKVPATGAPKETVDSTGREHDEKGRFKARPIPDKPKTEATDAKAAEPATKEVPGEKAETPPEAAAEEKKKGRPDARQRVEQATRAAAEFRRRAEAAERENQALRQAAVIKKEAPATQARPDNGDDPEPVLAEGDDPVEFVRKMSEHAARKIQREADQKSRAAHHAKLFQEKVTHYEDRVATAYEEALQQDPDLKERIDPRIMALAAPWQLEPGQRPTGWNRVAGEIATSDAPIKVILHLSEHEDEIQRFATLSPRELTRAMAKLEAKLEAATAGTTAPVPPYVPSAAQPVTPVTGAATTVEGPLDPETTSPEDWFRIMNERDRKRRRA